MVFCCRPCIAYSYDGQDRLNRIEHPDGSWIAYAYDPAGNRTELRTENQTVRYGYDKLNRLETVTACDNADCTAGDTTRYRYNKVGSRTAIVHANGTQTSYQYDNRHRLVELTTLDAFGGVVQSQRFTLGDAGHRLAVEEHGNRTVEYSYDALYRMTEERVTDPRGNRTTSYTFDATGNRLSRTVNCDPACNGEITPGTTSYSYDKNDRLLEETGPDGTTSYTYDDNGNTLEKASTDGLVSYTYDADDRLIKATGALESTATETRYVYDVHGVRHGQWVDGQVTRFLVDPNRDYAQVIEELDDQGQPNALYVFGHERISQDRNGTHSTYHADGLGSIRALSRLSGERTDRYDYNAYGQLEHSEGDTQNDFRYTGEQYDPNLGFYYLRARYYNPANGRFPTMDTYQGRIHEPQTLHKYLYVHGDPVNMVDPSGNAALAAESAGMQVRGTLMTLSTTTVRVGFPAANNAVYGTGAGLTYKHVGLLMLVGSGASGAALLNAVTGARVTAGELSKARQAGESRAISQGSRQDRRGRPKRAVIGENQSRVVSTAVKLQAVTIQYVSPYVFQAPLDAKEFALSIEFNRGWIRGVMGLRYDIFDIGRDPKRASSGEVISPWYAVELQEVKGYDRYFRIKPL